MALLSILNVLISDVYPVIASYKAYESYTDANRKFNNSNLSIGGFNVPINTLFKKATGEHDQSVPDEAAIVVLETIKLQKWFVYWVVHTTIELVSRGLFLKHLLPFYSLIKLGVSTWLIFPMLRPASDRLDPNTDLNIFYESGCGYCYKQFVTPLLKGEVNFVNQVSLDPNNKLYQTAANIVNLVMQYINKAPLSLFMANVAKSDSSQDSNVSAAAYLDSLKSYGTQRFQGFFRQTETTTESTATSNNKLDEDYDVIDTPESTEASGVSSEHVAKRKGWIW